MLVKIKQVVNYSGHNVKTNGSIDLTFKAKYDELTNSMQLLQMLNNDVNIVTKIPGIKKPIQLGMFRVKSVTFDGDGESTLKFNSIVDNVEMNNINSIVCKEEFQILMSADVELEDEDEEENDEEWEE